MGSKRPQNKKVVFLSSMHQTKQSDGNTEEINMYYNKTKGGVDSHDQKCSLFTTARRTNCWPMRLFYGILDCSIVNAFVIMSQMCQHLLPIREIRELTL